MKSSYVLLYTAAQHSVICASQHFVFHDPWHPLLLEWINKSKGRYHVKVIIKLNQHCLPAFGNEWARRVTIVVCIRCFIINHTQQVMHHYRYLCFNTCCSLAYRRSDTIASTKHICVALMLQCMTIHFQPS